MRPNNNKRMRGRNNNNNSNRRGPNPLTRSYESNGPDVKVRGTAAHVAEKYVQLARDAHSSGDIVMVESYLQHAEHYYRLIAAAQQQFQPQQNGYTPRESAESGDEDEEDFENTAADRFTFRAPQSYNQPAQANGQNGNYPAPYQATGGYQGGQPQAYVADTPGLGDQPVIEDGPHAADRQAYDRNGGERPFGPRPPRPDRPFGDRNRVNRNERGPGRPFRPDDRAQQRPPRFADAGPAEDPALPSFITAPVRPVAADVAEPADIETAALGGDEGAPKVRRRRGRPRLRPEGDTAPDLMPDVDGQQAD